MALLANDMHVAGFAMAGLSVLWGVWLRYLHNRLSRFEDNMERFRNDEALAHRQIAVLSESVQHAERDRALLLRRFERMEGKLDRIEVSIVQLLNKGVQDAS